MTTTQDNSLLAKYKYAVMDMDGVLYRGNQPLPGVQEFFAFVRKHNIPFLLLTNNSTNSSHDYSLKLERMGVKVSDSEIVTSGQATAAYLRQIAPEGAGIYVVGMQPLRDCLFGGDNAERFYPDDKNPRFVVQGGDFNLVYESVKRACLLIRKGATFIVTNADPVFPTEEGLIPGSGSIGMLLQVSTGQQPLVVGKPEAPMFRLALEQLGATVEETVMIGDNLLTDIEGANRIGMPTILTLSGVTNEQEYEISDIKATLAYKGLPELIAAWEAALG
ncbi:MAG TPA: HAD-IIA family hydrolase [Chloroflexia bacterium]|nr:HAD-IIA family hydrolase [Chloroflexia bacterium]